MGDLENTSQLLRGCCLGDEPHDQQPGRTRKCSKAALHWFLRQYGRGDNREKAARFCCDALTDSRSIFRFQTCCYGGQNS